MKDSIKYRKIKKVLFAGMLGLLLLPLVQQNMNFLNIRPLEGDFTPVEYTNYSKDTWFDGSYQLKCQDFLNQHFGFRNNLVRAYNQIYFSCFNEPKAKGVIIGQDEYLYEENYINAYLGRDFVGEDVIVDQVNKLHAIADSLETKGIDVIVVLAPGKASFYPEYIPEKFEPNRKTINNYEAYRDELLKSKINVLDLNQWFRDMKGKTDHPLYPKTGVHWSKYGEILAFDTMASYLENVRNINLPKIIIDEIETPNFIRETDDDIEKGMNLIFNIEDLKMGYPKLSFLESESDTKLNVITVADSYYWGIFGSGISMRLYENDQFWYYNQKIHASSLSRPLNVKDVNIQDEVEKCDVIVLLSTDASLHNFSFEFIDQLHGAYNGIEFSLDPLEHYSNAIKETPEWIKKVELQALKEGISVEEAIRKNAEYMIREEEKSKVE